MGRLRAIARLVAGAVGTVAVSVAANQVLSNGRLSWSWAYLSVAIAVLSLAYGELLAPVPSGGPAPARGSRRVYLRQLRASVADMETLGIATQSEFVLRMRQVYVDVSLQPKPVHETVREPFVGAADRVGERRSLDAFLRESEHGVLAVIGGPGSGKTTLVRNTALDLGGRWSRSLPVVMYLRDHAAAILAETPPDLPEAATSAGWLDGRIPAVWLRRRLVQGGCVVLLDGLDEVAAEADRGRVVSWIRRQIQAYPRNRYVLTSRPHGYQAHPLPDADVLQVRRFTGDQISRFLHAWYHAIERRATGEGGERVRTAAAHKADDLLDRLRATPALYDLAANPLLLTMIANVHRYRGQLPGGRAALYREMCDVLLHRRQEARNLKGVTDLRGPQKERVARRLALAMMRAKVRDLPVADACRAIRRALRQLPGNVAPETFLEEARRSGLLVEREHGMYGFAHLTMQEYLAAAELGRDENALLTSTVDDPWWRETTLLWAADNDATPVIRACLGSGTVAALSLAFDCADQALEADQEVRRELEELLASDQTDPARRRVVLGVMASRGLRDVVRLTDNTLVGARPVSRSLYAAFVREEAAAGRYVDRAAEADGEEAASGMWAGDVDRFLTWLNGLFDDGTAYRLPTLEELADPALDLVAGLDGRPVWAAGESSPRLHRGGAAVLTADQMYACLRADQSLWAPYVRLAGTDPLRRALVLTYGCVLTLALDPDRIDRSQREKFEFLVVCVAALGLASLDGAAARQTDRFSLAYRRYGTRPLSSRVLDRMLELAIAVDTKLAARLHRAGAPRGVMADDLAAVLQDALQIVLDEEIDGLAPVLGHAERVADAASTALSDRSRVEPLGTMTDHDRADILEPALDLVPVPGEEASDVLASALGAVIARWASRGLTPAMTVAVVESLMRSYAFPAHNALTTQFTDPVTVLSSLRRRLGDYESPVRGLREHAERLVDAIGRLIEPIAERTAPLDPRVLGCARVGLLGVAALCSSGVSSAQPTVGEAWANLAILEAEGDRGADGVILLVRT